MKPGSSFTSGHSPSMVVCRVACVFLLGGLHAGADESPGAGDARRLDLGDGVVLEVVFIPPGEFLMGSTAKEKAWATGTEGGAAPGTTRESFEGERPRPTRVPEAFWMGRTEVTVGQFRRFTEETGFVTDAEKPDGETQVFDPEWDGYHLTTATVQPWKSVRGKSWRDPNWSFPNHDDFPVVCVSDDDMRAFCRWLTRREAEAGRLPEGLEYRGGNSFDVPGNARCAVRLGIRGVTYSDSRDGFGICLGRRVPPPADPR